MQTSDCIFCKIVKGEIPSSKIWENDEFIAILELFPNTKGATLVISKQHVTSDIFKTDFKVIHNGLDAAKSVATLLQKALKPSRISLVTEGVFVDHLHIKLYPLYEIEKFNESAAVPEPIFYEKFPGFVTTHGGPQWNRERLEELAGEIKKYEKL